VRWVRKVLWVRTTYNEKLVVILMITGTRFPST
jgi:hypothetical protein